MVSESTIGKNIQLAFSKLGHRLFRINSGLGWIGESARFTQKQTVFVYPGDVLIRRARPLHAGFPGMSDYGGWMKDGRALYVEIKSEKGKLSMEQINFITAVNRAGGVAFVAYSVEEAIEKINT